MTKNIVYVGNLSFNTTEGDLETEFSKYGEIEEIKLISDRDTGRSKGFCFITYKTPESLEASLEKNGEDMDGRPLRVNKAEERKPRSDRPSFKKSAPRNGSSFGYGKKRY